MLRAVPLLRVLRASHRDHGWGLAAFSQASPTSQTSSGPDFGRPNVAKYDLIHSRRNLTNYSGPDSTFLENYDLSKTGDEGKEVQPGP
jgi:hypothetical protein